MAFLAITSPDHVLGANVVKQTVTPVLLPPVEKFVVYAESSLPGVALYYSTTCTAYCVKGLTTALHCHGHSVADLSKPNQDAVFSGPRQCGVTWGKVKQKEKIVFKSSGRRKKTPGKEVECRSGGSQETPWPKHFAVGNILL